LAYCEAIAASGRAQKRQFVLPVTSIFAGQLQARRLEEVMSIVSLEGMDIHQRRLLRWTQVKQTVANWRHPEAS
jgi:hypothetical protein